MHLREISREMLQLDVGQDLGNAEQPHHDRHQSYAVDQLHAVEGQPRRRVDRSMPIRPRMSPKQAMISAFSSEPCDR